MLQHVIPIALTPFSQDGSLDIDSIPTLTRFYRSQGASAIIVLGIMGEAHALTDRERETVIESYVAASNGLPIIATVSAPATEIAVERARRAEVLGASALMVAPPAGVNDAELLKTHFSKVALGVDLPWVLQDEPVTTGVRLSVPAIEALASAIPTMEAVKVEDVPTPSKVQLLAERLPQLGIFGGLGGLYLYEELLHGARGSMTGFSYPNILSDIVARYNGYSADSARDVFYRYLPLIRYEAQLGVRGIAIRKALFHQRGLITAPTVRAPAIPADPIIQRDLLDIVRALGLSLSAEESTV